jgi:2-haloacid dehalogenase
MQAIEKIVFDLYGTLFDVYSVGVACERACPGQGDAMARLWRQKQLEYTWLRSLMGRYRNFEHITEDALHYTCEQLGLALDEGAQQRLADSYLTLEPHADTEAALSRLHAHGIPLGIISNGSPSSIAAVVGNAGLDWLFQQQISVEPLGVFKPDPSVYDLAEDRMGIPRERILFVSSNAWDASAARNFGFPVCWINRQGQAFDQLDAAPTHTTRNLAEMAAWVLALR